MGKRFNIREHPDMERDINRRTAIKKELATLDRPARRDEKVLDKLLRERRLKKELAEIDTRLMEKRAALVHEIRPDLFMR